ncbi:MAG TPA: hypothetical protein VK509_00790 [Polyangiales bacterium]|nr:hypothetical protein [Polyangiales bacterium]
MHRRQGFDAPPSSLAITEYSAALRSVLRHAVGYALASALGASGCYSSADGVAPQPGTSSKAGVGDARGAMPVIHGPERVPVERAAANDSNGSRTPASAQMAGAAAPTPSGDDSVDDVPVDEQPSAGPAAPPPVHASQATPVTVRCEGGPPQLFTGLTPAQPFDAAEYRVQAMSSLEPQIWFGQGVLCASASDVTACQSEIARAADEPNLLFATALPMFGTIAQYVLTTRGDEVRKYQSRAELLQFLGPIDSPEDALLLLYYDHLPVPCTAPTDSATYVGVVPQSIRERDDGYEMLFLNQIIGCGNRDIERVTLHVATDGTVSELAREMMSESKGCEGRRPEGLRSRHVTTSASALGEHFARMAHLEHASIAAFEVLALELAAYGAPDELIAWARRSASDEVRHTATTRELARRFGVNPTEAEVASRPLRSLEAIAIENAREGCVRECFGAALGSYQAQSAGDPAVAAAMAQIAEDETRHAALAFAVDAWARSHLDERSRARVAAARAEAVDTLRCELAFDPDASTRSALGLPDAVAALRLCSALEQSLWAA